MKLAAKDGSIFLVVIMSLLCLAVGITGGWVMARCYAQHELTEHCLSGAWGNVHFVDSITEMPESFVKVESLPKATTLWYVEAVSPLTLKLKLRTCELSEQQVGALVVNSMAATNGPGYVIRPTDHFIVTLQPGERASLYALLARDVRNTAYAGPFRFDAASSQDWFALAHLPPPVEELVRKLVYRHNDMLLFADLGLVLRYFPDKDIYAALFRALTREATLMACLRVEPDADLKELAEYWGFPDRMDLVRSRLKMTLTAGAFHDIPLELLLPHFAFDRLYCYQCAEDPAVTTCHYSALNFFNDPPDLRFTNLAEVVRSLRADFVEVTDDFQLGDVVLLMKKGENVVHSCNYVADRIVFSKNGGSLAQPWVLTHLDDLVKFYSYPDPVTLKVMRRHDHIRH